jgi:hypothetical protein
MRVLPSADGTYRAELTTVERAALIWATEVGRAVLLRDPDLDLLARERAVRAELLDELADALVVGAWPERANVPS